MELKKPKEEPIYDEWAFVISRVIGIKNKLNCASFVLDEIWINLKKKLWI